MPASDKGSRRCGYPVSPRMSGPHLSPEDSDIDVRRTPVLTLSSCFGRKIPEMFTVPRTTVLPGTGGMRSKQLREWKCPRKTGTAAGTGFRKWRHCRRLRDASHYGSMCERRESTCRSIGRQCRYLQHFPHYNARSARPAPPRQRTTDAQPPSRRPVKIPGSEAAKS